MKITYPDNIIINKESPRLSIVFSFFNEENNLPLLLNKVDALIERILKYKVISSYELIFVNDDSTDSSEKILSDYIEHNSNCILINMARNFGNSECSIAGFTISTGDAVVYMDSDLQDPPELIEEMLNLWKSDIDTEVVFTTRNSRDGEGFFKLFITKHGYRFIKKISDIDLPVDSGDFKLLSKRVVSHILKMRESRPYLRGLISYAGFKQTQIFYDRLARNDGRHNTKYNLLSKRVLWGYLDRALISFSDFPLKLIFFLGLILFLISIFFIAYICFAKINGVLIPGWAGIMVTMIFFCSLQILFIGIIGLYIGSSFNEGKQRPLYIIKNIIRK
jgi:polyisoprenyl-phosphate glycosyltransferase